MDEAAAKLFRQNNSVLLSSQSQYLKANEIVQTAIEEQKELEAKAKAKELAKLKKKQEKNKKKAAVDEEPQEERPPARPRPDAQLRDLIRSERFEDRLEAQLEVEAIQRGLCQAGVKIPSHVLQQALSMPEDTVIPEELLEDRGAIIADYLFKNPNPKTTKKKKKKGKK